MSSSNKLTFDQVMTVLLGDDDEKRITFMKNNQISVEPVIKAVLRMVLSDIKDEQINPVKCLAKISEIEDNLLINTMMADLAVRETITKLVKDFLNNPTSIQDNQQTKELINSYLALLVNLTRQRELNETLVKLLLGDSTLNGFHQALVNSTNINDEELINLTINLLLNLSRSSHLLESFKENKEVASNLCKLTLKQFEQSVNSEIRCCLLLIIVNFLIPGSAQDILLDPKLELIPKILYPLAGATELEYDEEDMAQLPLDLQYLSSEKTREPSDKVRDALISCLLLCCNTKRGRDELKKNGTYFILREYHKWETNRSLQKRIEDVVDILIKEEDEFEKFPDLISTQVPDHLLGKFDEMDKDLVSN